MRVSFPATSHYILGPSERILLSLLSAIATDRCVVHENFDTALVVS